MRWRSSARAAGSSMVGLEHRGEPGGAVADRLALLYGARLACVVPPVRRAMEQAHVILAEPCNLLVVVGRVEQGHGKERLPVRGKLVDLDITQSYARLARLSARQPLACTSDQA